MPCNDDGGTRFEVLRFQDFGFSIDAVSRREALAVGREHMGWFGGSGSGALMFRIGTDEGIAPEMGWPIITPGEPTR